MAVSGNKGKGDKGAARNASSDKIQKSRIDSYAKDFFAPLDRAKDRGSILIPDEVEGYERQVYEEAVAQYNQQAGSDMLYLVDTENDRFVLGCDPESLWQFDNNMLSRILCGRILSHPEVYENTPSEIFYDFIKNETGYYVKDSLPDKAAYYFANGFPVDDTFENYKILFEDDPMTFYLSAKADNSNLSDVLDAYITFEDGQWDKIIAADKEMRLANHKKNKGMNAKKNAAIDHGSVDNDVFPDALADLQDDVEDKPSSADSSVKKSSAEDDAETVQQDDDEAIRMDIQSEYAANDASGSKAAKPKSRPLSRTARVDMGKPVSDAGKSKKEDKVQDAFSGTSAEGNGSVSRIARVFTMVADKTKPLRDAFAKKMHEHMDTVRACALAGYQVYRSRKLVNKIADYSAFLEKHGRNVSDVQESLMKAAESVSGMEGRDSFSSAFARSVQKNRYPGFADSGMNVADPAFGFKEKMHRKLGDVALGFKAAYAESRVRQYDNKIAGYQAKRDKMSRYLASAPDRMADVPVQENVQADVHMAANPELRTRDGHVQPAVRSDYETERIQTECTFLAKGGIYEKIVALRDYMNYAIEMGMETGSLTKDQQIEIGRQVAQAGRSIKRDAAGSRAVVREDNTGAEIIDIVTGQGTAARQVAAALDVPVEDLPVRTPSEKPVRDVVELKFDSSDFVRQSSDAAVDQYYDMSNDELSQYCDSLGI